MYDIMTPGPTQVRENVRQARALACTNPDLDADFYDFYKEICEEISELLHTKNETLILDGEGILGLEAACATLTEKGDRVLVMDNGEYGKGFAGFVTMYGGEPFFTPPTTATRLMWRNWKNIWKKIMTLNMRRWYTVTLRAGC